MELSQKKMEKEQFFADLYALDDLSGEDESLQPPPREPTPPRRREPPTVPRPKTKSTRKTKAPSKTKILPQVKQIFAGQTFFFIPNTLTAPHRRLRIEKAVQHGARWARAWSQAVTHVIVDKGLDMSDAVKCTGQKDLQIHVVKDVWLTESLGFKEMRNETAKRFMVPGAAPAIVPVTPTGVSRASPAPGQAEAAGSSKCKADRPRDALDDLVDKVKGTQDLPLEFDDTSPASSFIEYDAATLSVNKGFRCMEKNDDQITSSNPNAHTIKILQKMASYYEGTGEKWRTLAYRRGIAALRTQTVQIETKEQAWSIRQIGERLAEKIEEIVQTNRLQRLENAMADPHDQVLQLFMGIYQVGHPTASRWIAQGYRTLEELKSKASLTPNQLIGIEHYNDFLTRIPRHEVAEHAMVVQGELRRADPKLQLITGGSYRRGAQDSGDIDILITKENATMGHIRTLVVDIVVPNLTKAGFLKAALATDTTRNGGSKWHGASGLPGSKTWRRIDLLFVPWDELGAALIYFTGNDIFNRSIRLLASRKGMRLNQHGLYADVIRGEKRRRITEGRLLEAQSEQKIFDILGVPWRKPEDRQC